MEDYWSVLAKRLRALEALKSLLEILSYLLIALIILAVIYGLFLAVESLAARMAPPVTP